MLQICNYFVMREFTLSLSDDNKVDGIETFKASSKYLDDFLFNIGNP